jgi:hypothetical protein
MPRQISTQPMRGASLLIGAVGNKLHTGRSRSDQVGCEVWALACWVLGRVVASQRRLTELIGAVGGKLHTGRSRNDQVGRDWAWASWVLGCPVGCWVGLLQVRGVTELVRAVGGKLHTGRSRNDQVGCGSWACDAESAYYAGCWCATDRFNHTLAMYV